MQYWVKVLEKMHNQILVFFLINPAQVWVEETYQPQISNNLQKSGCDRNLKETDLSQITIFN